MCVGDERRAFDRAADAEAGKRAVAGAGLERAVDEAEQADELGPGRRDDVFDVAAARRELDDAVEAIEIGARLRARRGSPRRARMPTSAEISATTRSTTKLAMSLLLAMRSDWYGCVKKKSKQSAAAIADDRARQPAADDRGDQHGHHERERHVVVVQMRPAAGSSRPTAPASRARRSRGR